MNTINQWSKQIIKKQEKNRANAKKVHQKQLMKMSNKFKRKLDSAEVIDLAQVVLNTNLKQQSDSGNCKFDAIGPKALDNHNLIQAMGQMISHAHTEDRDMISDHNGSSQKEAGVQRK